ncbi:hypothetical protein ACFXOD_12140 [Streptomyces sp. NPDC059161]|uniref:hypothetical protein n=1 Tax=Streptomyces sp. NPDC059161 TaxID=3346749 RepID=UPI0036C0363B
MTASAELRRGLEALKTFKGRVDTLLADFEGSHAGSTNIAAHRIARASFSGAASPFPEADGLFTQYHRVHERLTALSKSLGHQIEAMGIAVHGADVGFDNLDEEARERFWAIQDQLAHEHDMTPDRKGDLPSNPNPGVRW